MSLKKPQNPAFRCCPLGYTPINEPNNFKAACLPTPNKMNSLISKQYVCPPDLSLAGDVPWVLMPAFIKSWFFRVGSLVSHSCLRWRQERECWGLLCQPWVPPCWGLDKPGQGCWNSQPDQQCQPGTSAWGSIHTMTGSRGLPGPTSLLSWVTLSLTRQALHLLCSGFCLHSFFSPFPSLPWRTRSWL